MKYLCLIYTDEDAELDRAEMEEWFAFDDELTKRGANLGGAALETTDTATTVRVRDGEILTTDGPFAETKEQLGGYYLIEASDLDEAIEIAAKIPSVRYGSVEVRPLWEIPERES